MSLTSSALRPALRGNKHLERKHYDTKSDDSTESPLPCEARSKRTVLGEIKGILDRCAQEPEFITGIVHETPERPNEFVFYELWKGTDFDAIQGRNHIGRPTWRTSSNFSKRWRLNGTHRSSNGAQT